MRVRIDEAGRDDQPRGRYLARAAARHRADLAELAVAHRHVGAAAGGAGAVDDESTANHEVVCRRLGRPLGRHGGLLYGIAMVLDHPSARRYPPSTMMKRATVESTADAYLELLAARGVEYFFANAGTDFAPLIEAYARRGAQGQASPRPITVPHEVPAVAMAHGYTMVSGRAQAVMVHVIVGAGNAAGGVINAARSNIPMLFSAGRNPITEAGNAGSRDRPIHWAQEAFDQAGMLREFVKWDYELKRFDQLETVVDRALTLAQSEPRGPVYLTLPREVLAERHDAIEYADPARAVVPAATLPDPAAVDEAAAMLGAARNPIIITKAARPRSGRGAGAGAARRDARRAGVRSVPHLRELPAGSRSARRLRGRPAPGRGRC